MDWREADARFAQLPKGRARHGTEVSRGELEAAVRDRRVLVLDRYADGHGGGSICVRMPEPASVHSLLVEPTRSFQRAVLVFDWLIAGSEDVALLDRHNAWDTFSEIPGWAQLFEERDDSTVRSEAVAALRRLEARHSEPWERAHLLFRSLRLGPRESADELSEAEVAAACSDGRVLSIEAVPDETGETWVTFSRPRALPPPTDNARWLLVFDALDLDDSTLTKLNHNAWCHLFEIPGLDVSPPESLPSERLVSAAEIEALGVTSDDEDAARIAAVAVRDADGVAIDVEATIAHLRAAAESRQRRIDEARAFAQKWGAPMDEVTDEWDDHHAHRLSYERAASYLSNLLAAFDLGLRGPMALVTAHAARLHASGAIDPAATAESLREAAARERGLLSGLGPATARLQEAARRKLLAEHERTIEETLAAARALETIVSRGQPVELGRRPLEAAQRAVLADPHPDGPRLAFAEVCAAHDPPRAELIHAQLEMARRRAAGDAGWTTPFRRVKELLEEHGARWAGRILDLAPKHRFFRGFVEQVTIDAADFLERAPALYAAAPIRRLHLRRVAPVAEVLFASPHLDRIVGLTLTRDRLDDSTVEALAASEHLGRLAWLDLGFNRITRRGYEALLRSSLLPALQYVSVTANPGGDLCEPTGMDHVDGSLAGGATPAWVADIEREVGPRPWVHLEARLGRMPFAEEY